MNTHKMPRHERRVAQRECTQTCKQTDDKMTAMSSATKVLKPKLRANDMRANESAAGARRVYVMRDTPSVRYMKTLAPILPGVRGEQETVERARYAFDTIFANAMPSASMLQNIIRACSKMKTSYLSYSTTNARVPTCANATSDSAQTSASATQLKSAYVCARCVAESRYAHDTPRASPLLF